MSVKIGCDVRFRKWSKRFLFEHKWMMEEDFYRVMDQWKDNGNIVDLPSKLSHFSGSLSLWAGYRFSELPRKIELLHKELNGLIKPTLANLNYAHIYELEHNIEKLVLQE